MSKKFLILGVTLLLPPVSTDAQQQAASLEFSVRAKPTGGRAEKVMRQPFFLLRENLETIERLAREQTPGPDFGDFVEDLPVSDELKEWMKEHETVQLRGDEFISSLTVDDIMDVPEFRQAYAAANQVMVGLGFPRRKSKLSDRKKNPDKWKEDDERYWEEVRSYLELHPESKQRMDQQLLDINAVPQWNALQRQHEKEVRQQMLRLIHNRFLVARTETDYEGFARITGIPPGRYWLTTLWDEVRAGNVRLRWELPVELRPGQQLYLELNNANARFDSPSL